MRMIQKASLIAGLFFLVSVSLKAQSVSPIMGLGNLQVIDNNGQLATSGYVYFYQAGTTTQQAVFADSLGQTQLPNPVPLGQGARANIWLSTGQFYKVVGCAANDGPFCNPSDVLFQVDNIPGGPSSGGGGGCGSTCTSIFISSSATPATSGALRLASSDSVCWRNASGSTNLCMSKDANDLLTWAGGSMKFPEILCPSGPISSDLLCADSTAHRFKMSNNGNVVVQIVAAGVDINASDQVTQLHFGATATPLSGTAPTTGQILQWNGSNIVGTNTESTVTAAVSNINLGQPANTLYAKWIWANAHTITRFTLFVQSTSSGCTTNAAVAMFDETAGSAVTTLTTANGSVFYDSGPLAITTTAGHTFDFRISTADSGCTTHQGFPDFVVNYQ